MVYVLGCRQHAGFSLDGFAQGSDRHVREDLNGQEGVLVPILRIEYVECDSPDKRILRQRKPAKLNKGQSLHGLAGRGFRDSRKDRSKRSVPQVERVTGRLRAGLERRATITVAGRASGGNASA